MKLSLRLLAIAAIAFAPVITAEGAFAESKECPPGLAKKNPPCLPPGQAKKGVSIEEWRNGDRIGDVIGRDDVIILEDYRRYDLPLLPSGQRYAVVHDQIVVINPDNYVILQVIRAFTNN